MIAARFGGDAAFKDPLTDLRLDANALVGHFNNQLLVAELYQHLHRRVGKRRPLRRFDSVIQQVANNRNQLLFPQRQERPVQPTGRVETQLDPFLPRAGGFPQQQAAQGRGAEARRDKVQQLLSVFRLSLNVANRLLIAAHMQQTGEGGHPV